MADSTEIKAKKEILIYSPIYDYTAESIVEEINEFADEDTLTIRLHTPGGQVMSGYAVLSRLTDRKGAANVFVDGEAYSMGAYIALYGNEVIASEMAKFMFHKAAYPNWYEPTEMEKEQLKEINASFKVKMKSRFNDSQLAKDTIAKVFEPDVINDVYLSAKQAKEVGLVIKIKPLDLGVKAQIEQYTQMYASFEQQTTEVVASKPQILLNMNIQELKAQHPALFDEVFAAGRSAGAVAERDRVGSFLAFLDVDPKAVKAGIESGNPISETQRSEFALASYRLQANSIEQTENPKSVQTPNAPKKDDAEAILFGEINAAVEKQGLNLKK